MMCCSTNRGIRLCYYVIGKIGKESRLSVGVIMVYRVRKNGGLIERVQRKGVKCIFLWIYI